MAIHIGKIIHDKIKHKEISITEFADKINTTRRNAYKIFNKPNIDTELLIKISEVVGENFFFNYISDQEVVAYGKDKIIAAQLMNSLKELKATMIYMEQKKDMENRVEKKRKLYKGKTNFKK